MGRTTPRAETILADIRAYFGLLQWEMAGLLMVDEANYRELESGRRRLTAARTVLVLPLLAALPAGPPPGPVPAEPAPPPALPPPHPALLADADPAPLAARLDYCRHTAARLRRQTRPYATRARAVARWVAALPALRAAPPFSTDPRARAWLDARPVALPAYQLQAWAMLVARAQGLEAEAAALTAWSA